MSEELNPYTPPQVLPTPAASEIQYPDSGSLWRVVDGKLQVREMASLPDIAIKGEPADEPGKRLTMVMRCMPEWIYGLVWLGIAAVDIAGLLSNNRFLFYFLIAAILSAVLGKKVRVTLFRTHAEMRRTILKLLLFVVSIAVLGYLVRRFAIPQVVSFWKGGALSLMAIYFGVLHIVQHLRGGSLGWGRGRGDGWFELSGIAPMAIVRLEKVQQRRPPPLVVP